MRVRLSEYFSSGIGNKRFKELVEEFQVRDFAVSLIPGRCGSTLLSSMCSRYGFGRGNENFNEAEPEILGKIAGSDEFDIFLSRVFQDSVLNHRFYFQLTPHRLVDLFKLVPADCFENIKATCLFRRNVFAQALSYYNALRTGIWHTIQDAQTPTEQDRDGEFNPIAVLNWVWRLLRIELQSRKACQEISSHSLVLYYEDLVASPIETLSTFLAFHGVPVESGKLEQSVDQDKGPLKIVRQDYAEQYLRLRSVFPMMDHFVAERLERGANPALSSEIIKALPPDAVPSVGIQVKK